MHTKNGEIPKVSLSTVKVFHVLQVRDKILQALYNAIISILEDERLIWHLIERSGIEGLASVRFDDLEFVRLFDQMW